MDNNSVFPKFPPTLPFLFFECRFSFRVLFYVCWYVFSERVFPLFPQSTQSLDDITFLLRLHPPTPSHVASLARFPKHPHLSQLPQTICLICFAFFLQRIRRLTLKTQEKLLNFSFLNFSIRRRESC